MPVTNVRAPSGEIVAVQHPEGATQAEIIGYAKANFMTNVKAQTGDEKYMRQAMDDGVGTNMAAAFGGALPEALRLGVKGIFGKNQPGEVQDWKDSMTGLISTAGGKAGAFFGAAAPMTVAAMTPPGQTVLGSLMAGVINGAIQPAENTAERTRNAAKDGFLNAAFPAAVALGKTGAAVASPLTQSGNERIAGRVLDRFATDPAKLSAASGGRTPSGAFPTLAESTGDIGVANLQNILQSRDPRALIAGRYAENNAARVGALTAMGGTDAELAKALARRKSIGGSAYDKAGAAGVDDKMAEALRPQIENLLERPAVKKAIEAARDKAANEGIAVSEFGSPTGLKYLKQELDDLALGFQKGSNDRRIYDQLSSDVDSVLREIVPDMKRADKIYARLSREPNRMQVARELKEETTSALRDFDGNPAIYANKFASTLNRSSPKVVSAAMGRKTEKTIDDVLSADQLKVVDDILNGVERQAATLKTRVGGSPTARNIIGDDIVSRIAGPLGVPQSWAQGALAENFLARPASWFLKSSEEKLNDTLMRAMIDPGYASVLVGKSRPSPLAQRGAGLLQHAAPAIQGGLLGGYPLLQSPQ